MQRMYLQLKSNNDGYNTSVSTFGWDIDPMDNRPHLPLGGMTRETEGRQVYEREDDLQSL